MDWRAAFNAAEGVRPQRHGDMVRRRRRRGSEGRFQHAHRQSDGRLCHRLWHERRGYTASERFFRCACVSPASRASSTPNICGRIKVVDRYT